MCWHQRCLSLPMMVEKVAVLCSSMAIALFALPSSAEVPQIACHGEGNVEVLCQQCNEGIGQACTELGILHRYGDVIAVGENGTILRWRAGSWSVERTGGPRLLSIWGTSPDDIWVVGRDGRVMHFNGRSWSARRTRSGSDLYGVWGTGPRDVWAVGDHSMVLNLRSGE